MLRLKAESHCSNKENANDHDAKRMHSIAPRRKNLSHQSRACIVKRDCYHFRYRCSVTGPLFGLVSNWIRLSKKIYYLLYAFLSKNGEGLFICYFFQRWPPSILKLATNFLLQSHHLLSVVASSLKISKLNERYTEKRMLTQKRMRERTIFLIISLTCGYLMNVESLYWRSSLCDIIRLVDKSLNRSHAVR